jgi:hypothetical protein
MPILGTYASQFSSKPFGSFESIQTVTVGAGGSSSISFTSIPSTYKHLQIKGIAKETTSAGPQTLDMFVKFNSSSSGYKSHYLSGNGTSATAGVGGGGATDAFYCYGASYREVSATSTFGVSIIDIHDYASTTKNKTARAFAGCNFNSASTDQYFGLSSGLWADTSAITSIVITPNDTFKENTTFALYGIKG